MSDLKIKFITFGRCKINDIWYLNKRISVNRLYIIEDGIGWFIKNGVRYQLKKGYIYLFFSNSDVYFESDAADPIVHSYFDFIISPAFYSKDETEIRTDCNNLIKHAAELAKTFLSNTDIYNNTGTAAEMADICLRALLYAIDCEKNLTFIRDKRINSALDYIHQNYKRQISVCEIAASQYMEENYFIKFFKKNMGITVYKYLKNYRLNIGDRVLKNGGTVAQAAAESGFLTTVGFSNAYKSEYGRRPSQTKTVTRHVSRDE